MINPHLIPLDVATMPREQAMKVLEESAELFSAAENYQHSNTSGKRRRVLEEFADCLQALETMAHVMGFADEVIDHACAECHARQASRGRCSL